VREPNVFAYYDIEKEFSDLQYWMNKLSLRRVDALTKETDAISKMLNEPRGVLFIDRHNHNTEADSRIALDALKRVAAQYFS
jgi:hypothetical protein